MLKLILIVMEWTEHNILNLERRCFLAWLLHHFNIFFGKHIWTHDSLKPDALSLSQKQFLALFHFRFNMNNFQTFLVLDSKILFTLVFLFSYVLFFFLCVSYDAFLHLKILTKKNTR